MVRAMVLFRSPSFEFGWTPSFGWRGAMIAMGFASGVAAGLVHARMLGLL